MRKVKIGGEEYSMVASPMTLYFYSKEFKSDLLSGFMEMDGMEEDYSKFSGINILKMGWAMIKTYHMGKFEDFEQWLSNLEYVDFEDADMILNITSEAQKGFFRQ